MKGHDHQQVASYASCGSPSQRRPARRAMVTFVVLVCLVMITLIGGGLLRLARSERASIRAEERGLQADWLAESALERASAILANDGDYRGETWSIPAVEFGGTDSGSVRIEVEDDPDDSSRRVIKVRADYPDEPERRVRRSKRAIVASGSNAGARNP